MRARTHTPCVQSKPWPHVPRRCRPPAAPPPSLLTPPSAAAARCQVNLPNIILAFAGRVLMNKTSFYLERGPVYGLVGQNGVGKTTLLNRCAAHLPCSTSAPAPAPAPADRRCCAAPA